MNSYQRLEIEARAFQIMTGRLAPFKDSPAAAGSMDMADLQKCWQEWRDQYSHIIHAMEAAFEEVMR